MLRGSRAFQRQFLCTLDRASDRDAFGSDFWRAFAYRGEVYGTAQILATLSLTIFHVRCGLLPERLFLG